MAEWLDQQELGNRQPVSVGTATEAPIPNGLGFSNRRLYLVPQFFADKPVAHLLRPGIMAEDLNDDCLGRTLDWLYEHDVTRLFAGLALQTRRTFAVEAARLHVDTTSFSVHGHYAPDTPEADRASEGVDEGEPGEQGVTVSAFSRRCAKKPLPKRGLSRRCACGSSLHGPSVSTRASSNRK